MSAIDLNADVGEMDPHLDEAIIAAVSSVNIACGGHAGDEVSMSRVAGLAAARGVRIGAHPSYVDREGFGRTRQTVPVDTLIRQIRDQIAALQSNSASRVAYVKPHGALYHAAATDPHIAQALVTAADGLALMGQAGSVYLEVGRAHGLEIITEGFADRAYRDDGRLVPRGEPGAVLQDAASVLEQVSGLARGRVRSHSGQWITVTAESVCLHSDTPGAAQLAHRIVAHLRATGIAISA